MSIRTLYVGNWGFHPAPKGISVFDFHEENGALTLRENMLPEIAAGQLCLDRKKRILYAVNECGDRPGEYGGGGELLSFRIGEDGNLTLLNRRDSLCPEPSYLCIDRTGEYLLACHCADPFHVTKLKRQPDGTLTNEVLFDDGGVILYRLEPDGSIGAAVDALTWPGQNRLSETSKVNVDPVSGHVQLVEIISRLHSVLMSPDGEMFITCDKGMDRIYAFKLDRERERLVHTDTFQAAWSSFPRYAAFHPTLPMIYVNSEWCGDVNVLTYDSKAGTLRHAATVSALDRDYGLVDGKPVGAQDILLSPDGRTMYVTTCGIHAISVFTTDEDGIPHLRDVVNSRGRLPRGLTFSPDGRFLLSGNMLSGDVTVFRVKDDGGLEFTGNTYAAVSPSALRFL